MPKTRSLRNPAHEPPAPVKILACETSHCDGYPLGDARVALCITAEMTEAECQRIVAAWETGERYAVTVAGRPHGGRVRGNVAIRDNRPGWWTVTFRLLEEPAP